MKEAEVVAEVIFVAGDQTPGIMEPGKEPLDLPAALVAAQFPGVLGVVGPKPAGTVRGN